MSNRRKRVGSELKARNLEALLVTDIKNIRYLTGFTGSSAYLLITGGKQWFMTDARYAEQAKSEVSGFTVKIYSKPVECIFDILASLSVKVLGFEGEYLKYEAYQVYKKKFKGVRLVATTGLIGELRQVKDASEVISIKRSAALLDKGYELIAGLIKPGVRERDVALDVEFALRRMGADALAFDTIVASGERSAMPHGKASGKIIKKGELVIVDMGVELKGYASDETRTYCTGMGTAAQRKIYDVVLGAQSAAIECIRPGLAALDVDRAARGYIEKAGYGRFFGHGTGHGVGLDVHELPGVGPYGKAVLAEGMVITVEPGIYVPGIGGVRIEDLVLVTKGGFELLTKTPRGFLCL